MGQTTIADEEVRSPESGEVLIRTEVTLISPGTERAFLLGLPNTPRHFPRKYGYCNVGEIIELGSGVSGAAVGDRVLSGGNHAQFVVVSAGNVFRIPEEVPSREAVFANLTSISIQAVRKASIELGEPVLIIGQGLIGNLALQLSRLSG
ncbi:MAG: hypothetical protein QF886_01230, partial [Planctomycetota bacterium]|nr:hypothetical protein [Planctomycetota bacterium]